MRQTLPRIVPGLARLPGLALIAALAAGCLAGASSDGGDPFAGTVSLSEGFEAGSKTSYAAADVTLASGVWNLDDALIGTTASDVKTGAKAARLRNSGHVTMGFDHATGAGTVTIHHARFGSDGNGTWGLFASQDHGATYSQVGATVSTTTTTFATATFTVNLAGAVRFDLRKLDGGANRIDVDDIAVTDFTGPPPPPPPPNPITTVFVIVMENHNWSSIKGSASAPYINNTLLTSGAHAENYLNVPGLHPSEPNYLWLEAGTNFGVTTDSNPSTNHQASTQHLVTQLQAAGISWKSYQEDITGTSCPLTATGLYAPKHNPMVFFDDVTSTNSTTSQNCIQHVRPYTELATDLQAGTVARYNFITPNLCHDMHNSTGCATTDSIANGDAWLSTEVPKILASQAYKTGGALLITWDESEGGDVPIGMIVMSPFIKAPGYSNTIAYSHSSTLRTVQEIFGVTPLLGGAATATNLSDLFATTSGGPTGASVSVHTTLGLPSPTSTSNPNSFLSVKSGYVVSYNGSRKAPNWVSWELNTSYFGTTPRQNDFRPDDTFPTSEPQAALTDFVGSGFDRGHMCPSDDRTLTVAANSQTFYLTNMVAQSANANRGPWEKLEAESRSLANSGKELFVIAGGVFSASSRTIGSGVVVPDQTFKVVVVLDPGQGPRAVTTSTRVIAILMPNDDSKVNLTDDWRPYRVSVDAIEALTGYDFLSDVDPAVQAVIEARVDNL